jgi:hypothetical protein
LGPFTFTYLVAFFRDSRTGAYRIFRVLHIRGKWIILTKGFIVYIFETDCNRLWKTPETYLYPEKEEKMTAIRLAFISLCLMYFLVPSSLISQAEPTLSVARLVVCEGIENREPTFSSMEFSPNVNQIYCFTEVLNAGDPTTITHRWYHGENLLAEVPLNVQGVRYRTWSTKQIVPQATGEWRVEVVDEAGSSLGEVSFRVSEVVETTPAE